MNLNRTTSTVLIRQHNYLSDECEGVNESNYKPERINIFYCMNRIVNRMIIQLSPLLPSPLTVRNLIYNFMLEDTCTIMLYL